MALKKSQLYSSLWSSCDELRGGMDASQYKDYVLTLLFMKYVSDKYAGKQGQVIEVPTGGSFADMAKLKGDKEIGDKINKIIGKLAEANDLKGVIDIAEFNDEDKLGKGQEMVDRLSKLVGIFESLDFSTNRAEGDDLLGDAYEYLMRHFATDSGKSKGQFYTPAEVSRVMAKVVGIGPETLPDDTVYDPTCGSGSLLLKTADEAPNSISIFGQENDLATWALARMNMILHGHATADLWKGNTLADPHFKSRDGSLRTFDFAVANPPFSAKAWTNGVNLDHDPYERFTYGVPPAKNGDYAFLLHLIKSLKSKGKGAIILPHGVLFRGNKEADIRRNLVKNGLIKGIIGLPPNLFYGTGIPACVVVIDKENAQVRSGIFMIDASKGFIKDGNKNRLREQDIHKIVDVFNRQLEVPRYSHMVPVSEIANPANDYNLNIPRYIDSSDAEDLHDLDAHLRGGIPNRDLDALQAYWQVFPSLRTELFEPGDRPGYSRAKVEGRQVKPTILKHPEFTSYSQTVTVVFESWCAAHETTLKSLKEGVNAKAVIRTLAEDLLARFAALPLLDRYDVYQRLMDYWAETMQDGVYLIGSDGWVGAAKPRTAIEIREGKKIKFKEKPDLTVKKKKYKMDLLPPGLIIARYFSAEQAQLDSLDAKRQSLAAEVEEFIDENSGEEGTFDDPRNEKGTVTKENLQQLGMQVAEAQKSGDAEQVSAIERCLQLIRAESDAAKSVKEAQAALDAKVLAHYPKLSDEEIKMLVVEDKWINDIRSSVAGEVRRLTLRLAGRITELDERYGETLPDLKDRVAAFSDIVDAHIKKMGLVFA
jgi:type I restriction enzyme M protein